MDSASSKDTNGEIHSYLHTFDRLHKYESTSIPHQIKLLAKRKRIKDQIFPSTTLSHFPLDVRSFDCFTRKSGSIGNIASPILRNRVETAHEAGRFTVEHSSYRNSPFRFVHKQVRFWLLCAAAVFVFSIVGYNYSYRKPLRQRFDFVSVSFDIFATKTFINNLKVDPIHLFHIRNDRRQ